MNLNKSSSRTAFKTSKIRHERQTATISFRQLKNLELIWTFAKQLQGQLSRMPFPDKGRQRSRAYAAVRIFQLPEHWSD